MGRANNSRFKTFYFLFFVKINFNTDTGSRVESLEWAGGIFWNQQISIAVLSVLASGSVGRRFKSRR